MVDVFSDFCFKYDLTVNMKKTEVVVFSCSIRGVTANIRYRDTVVPQKLKYRYLGVWFDSVVRHFLQLLDLLSLNWKNI